MKRIFIVLIIAIIFYSCGGNNGRQPPSTEPYLTWDVNQELDLAGYIVYWGPRPGDYERSLDVEMDRVVYINQLDLYLVTHFAITAYDTSDNESDYSEEVIYEQGN